MENQNEQKQLSSLGGNPKRQDHCGGKFCKETVNDPEVKEESKASKKALDNGIVYKIYHLKQMQRVKCCRADDWL